MLTVSERQFIDLYIREGFTHDYNGHAHNTAFANGIVYDDFVDLYQFYKLTWANIGAWPDHNPPIPPNPELPCPWASRADLIIRLNELRCELIL